VLLVLSLVGVVLVCCASCADDAVVTQDEKKQAVILKTDVEKHLGMLTSDEFLGRGSLSPNVKMTEDYIAEQFKAAGLQEFEQFPDYRHTFKPTRRSPSEDFTLDNIVGYLEGTDPVLKNEYVIYSAHHDHLGVKDNVPQGEDSIYNGADDNATGTTAVMVLAKYYAEKADNKRTLVFMTFAAEEAGMLGSRQIVQDLPFDKENIAAVLNFEMLGLPSPEGKPQAFVTGFHLSDLEDILQESLGQDDFQIVDGPEIAKRFYGSSDNISFAREGVIAHTIGGIRSTENPQTHTVDDELETIDIENVFIIIKGMPKAAQTIISGEKTPKPIEQPIKQPT
ncbi:MAG: M28 family peptidase, partial [Planctomycetes bacterium]|nr:M28 family peptidase [Planctomycetota bacterium]